MISRCDRRDADVEFVCKHWQTGIARGEFTARDRLSDVFEADRRRWLPRERERERELCAGTRSQFNLPTTRLCLAVIISGVSVNVFRAYLPLVSLSLSLSPHPLPLADTRLVCDRSRHTHTHTQMTMTFAIARSRTRSIAGWCRARNNIVRSEENANYTVTKRHRCPGLESLSPRTRLKYSHPRYTISFEDNTILRITYSVFPE